MTEKLIDGNTVDIKKSFWIIFVYLYQIVCTFLYWCDAFLNLREEGKNTL